MVDRFVTKPKDCWIDWDPSRDGTIDPLLEHARQLGFSDYSEMTLNELKASMMKLNSDIVKSTAKIQIECWQRVDLAAKISVAQIRGRALVCDSCSIVLQYWGHVRLRKYKMNASLSGDINQQMPEEIQSYVGQTEQACTTTSQTLYDFTIDERERLPSKMAEIVPMADLRNPTSFVAREGSITCCSIDVIRLIGDWWNMLARVWVQIKADAEM